MRNEGGGGIVEVIALLAVDDAIVQISFRQSATPVALLLRRLAGARTVAGSAGGRPT